MSSGPVSTLATKCTRKRINTWMTHGYIRTRKGCCSMDQQRYSLGHAVTSRGEYAHSRLETYLDTIMLDLLQCCKRIKVSIECFLTDYRAKRAGDQIQTPLFAYPSPKTDIFQNVTKSVSNFALSKVNEKASPTCDDSGKLYHLFIYLWSGGSLNTHADRSKLMKRYAPMRSRQSGVCHAITGSGIWLARIND